MGVLRYSYQNNTLFKEHKITKTIRQYAEENGFQIVGKLTRKVSKREVFDWNTCEMKTISTIYWVDEAGNEYSNNCIVTADGAVI